MIPPTDVRRSLLLAVLLTLIVLVAGMVPSAGQTEESPTETPITEVGTDLVVTMTERDPDTGAVTVEAVAPVSLAGTSLPPEAVSVVIDDELQDFRYEAIATDDLGIMLVLDTSGSMRGEALAAAQDAASSFVELLPDAVEVGAIAFSGEAQLIAPLGVGSDELIGAVNELEASGETALFDALVLASEQFGTAQPGERRVIVALTDGADSASNATLQDARKAIADVGIHLDAVALATSETAAETFELLTAGTDGRVSKADSADALRPLYDELAAELASRFRVVFTPPRSGSGRALLLVNHEGTLASSFSQFEAMSTTLTSTSSAPRETTPTQDDSSPASPESFVGTITDWASTTTARNVGIGLIAVVLLIIGLLISFPTAAVSQLAGSSRDRVTSLRVGDLTDRLEHAADRALEKGDRRTRLSRALERAGIELRPSEFIVLAGAIAVTVSMVVSLFTNAVVAVVTFFVAIAMSRSYVTWRAKRRTAAFVDQLPATIQLIAGALRAGYALPQAAETVANEAESPTRDEFHRLVTEHRLGRDFSDALEAMDARMDAEDFSWIVQAIGIHREVGGDLAEVLDNVHETMRDRSFIRRQFAAVSAEGRYSAYLIVSLPFVVMAVLFVTNPAYVGKLFDGTRGYLALMLAASLMTMGSLWMRALMKVRF